MWAFRSGNARLWGQGGRAAGEEGGEGATGTVKGFLCLETHVVVAAVASGECISARRQQLRGEV